MQFTARLASSTFKQVKRSVELGLVTCMFFAVMLLQTLGLEHTMLPDRGAYCLEVLPWMFSNTTSLMVNLDYQLSVAYAPPEW